MSNKTKDKFFCSRCGKRLVLVSRKVSHYDTKTGEGIYERRYECPSVGLFGRVFGHVHNRVVVVEGALFDGTYHETVLR